MTRLLALGAACHQITFIVVESWLFRGLRDAAQARSAHLGRLLSCHLCFGTWVGLALAALFRPQSAVPSGRARSPLRGVAEWAVDAFLISLVARALNEVLAAIRHEVALKRREAEVLEAAVERGEEGPLPQARASR